MSKEKIVCSVEVDNAIQFLEIPDVDNEKEKMQFCPIELKFYSDELNAHGYICSKEDLEKYAPTILGKPILAWYNQVKKDCGGHEDTIFAKEHPIGFIPTNAEVTYKTDENGVTYSYVVGYIWSVYYDNIVEVFINNDGMRNVSSEVGIFASHTDDDGQEVMDEFSFLGITILGNVDSNNAKLNPAVKGCEARVVNFSISIADEDVIIVNNAFEKAKKEFEKKLYNSNMEEVSTMDKEMKNSVGEVDIVENATDEIRHIVSVEDVTCVDHIDDDGHYAGYTEERHEIRDVKYEKVEVEEPTEPIVDNAEIEECATEESTDEPKEEEIVEEDCSCKEEDSIVENAEETSDEEEIDYKEECAKLEAELNACKEELASCKESLNACTVKCSELEEYKLNKETEQMNLRLNQAFATVQNSLTVEELDVWKDKATKCSIENVDGFINELKSFAFDKGNVVQDTMRCSISSLKYEEKKQSKGDFWANLKEQYNI